MPTCHVLEYRSGTTRMHGLLARPDGLTEVRPGILVVHEWWGRTNYPDRRATMLAELGYVAMAVDMYGEGRQAKDVAEAGKYYSALMGDIDTVHSRILAAYEILRAQPEVDPRRIVCLGYCMGGTVTLELARSGAELAGFVSFHGALTTSRPAGPGQIRGAVLVLHGAADPMIGADQIAGFREEMTRAGADWQFHEFGGAMHGFTRWDANMPEVGIKYDAVADRRAWALLQLFLTECFSVQG